MSWVDLAPGGASGDALFAAIASADLGPDTQLWVAGEAAAMQRIRRHLFDERDVPRARAYVRGYWKHGGTGSPDDTDL